MQLRSTLSAGSQRELLNAARMSPSTRPALRKPERPQATQHVTVMRKDAHGAWFPHIEARSL